MVGMVMLLMLTLVAVGVIRMAGRHSQVVDNAQVRSEASAAGHYALDLVLNEPATTWDDLKTAERPQHRRQPGHRSAAPTTPRQLGQRRGRAT